MPARQRVIQMLLFKGYIQQPAGSNAKQHVLYKREI